MARLQNSPYFCVFKYARVVKQKVWNEAETRERDWEEALKIRACEACALRARKIVTPRFTHFFTYFEKKNYCLQSIQWRSFIGNLLAYPFTVGSTSQWFGQFLRKHAVVGFLKISADVFLVIRPARVLSMTSDSFPCHSVRMTIITYFSVSAFNVRIVFTFL